MTAEELKKNMSAIRAKANTTAINKIIAMSVQLGMQYQEEKIKEGINIVFTQLHEKI